MNTEPPRKRWGLLVILIMILLIVGTLWWLDHDTDGTAAVTISQPATRIIIRDAWSLATA